MVDIVWRQLGEMKVLKICVTVCFEEMGVKNERSILSPARPDSLMICLPAATLGLAMLLASGVARSRLRQRISGGCFQFYAHW